MTSPTPDSARQPAASTWPLVHAERVALAADLAGLSSQQWATQSLCENFTVREVLAHLTAGATLSPARWMAGVIRCRFDFDRQVAIRLAEHLGASPAETLAAFRRALTSTTKPPLRVVAMLGEVIVHAQDIRRPLGIQRDYPVPALTAVATCYQASDLPVNSNSRVRGLRLTATDGPFAAGAGPRMSGTTLALIMAMAGRGCYAGELDGDGAAVFREREAASREGARRSRS